MSHPIQYFASVFRELASRSDVDPHVLFRTRVGVDPYFDAEFGRDVQWDTPLVDGYSHEFLSSRENLDGIEWSVRRALAVHRPDVLLMHGYSQPTNLLALSLAKLSGIKVLVRGDTRLSDRHSKSALKTLGKRAIFRWIDGFVAVGRRNADYYRAMGVADERIHFAPFSVDNASFDLADRWGESRRDARRRLGLAQDATVLTFASKMTARKRASDLLSAFEHLRSSHPEAVLVIAGSGPEERALRAKAEPLGAGVTFVGFQNQSELPALFAASDVFVLPSSDEPWGLVVNEAMAAGLPVVVSDDVGAAPDLVEGKGTGYVYPVGNIARLAECLSALAASEDLRRQMGRAARALIAEWTPRKAAAGIATAAWAVAK